MQIIVKPLCIKQAPMVPSLVEMSTKYKFLSQKTWEEKWGSIIEALDQL